MKYKKSVIFSIFLFAWCFTSNSYSFLPEFIDALSRCDYEKLQQLIDTYMQQHRIDRETTHWTMLQAASHNRLPEIIDLLVIVGCVDIDGVDIDGIPSSHPPLHLACLNGDIKTIDSLCRHGANPYHKSLSGSLAIHACAQYNTIEAVNYMITLAPDSINSECHAGYTPLSSIFKNIECKINAQLPVIHYLLSNGANPNSIMPYQKGNTILHNSVSRNLYGVVIALIINNVNLSPLNSDNQTPLEIMEECPEHNSGMLSILGPAISAGTSSRMPDKRNLPRNAFSLQNWAVYWIRAYFNHMEISRSPLPVRLICFVLYNSYDSSVNL